MNLDLIFTEENYQKLYILAVGVSALLLIWTISQTINTLREYRYTTSTPPSHSVSGHGNRLVNNTLAAKLFGEYKEDVQATPVTALNWKLRGIFKSSDRKHSNVIVENSEGEASQYRIGDEIESGITVHDILSDRVILKRNGKYEALMIDPDKLQQAPVDQQLFNFNQPSES